LRQPPFTPKPGAISSAESTITRQSIQLFSHSKLRGRLFQQLVTRPHLQVSRCWQHLSSSPVCRQHQTLPKRYSTPEH
jgi:hypothetical protein